MDVVKEVDSLCKIYLSMHEPTLFVALFEKGFDGELIYYARQASWSCLFIDTPKLRKAIDRFYKEELKLDAWGYSNMLDYYDYALGELVDKHER